MAESPSISFGIIVLNGEPFTRYCLRSLYPFAHEIIVVEGACQAAASTATPDGHSTDGTFEVLRRFKADEDPEDKLRIVNREGFWSEKDEQSQAYAELATGDYLWQVDIDEFYHPEDMRAIIEMLANDPSITGVSFYWKNFWGGFNYLVDGWKYRDAVKRMRGIRRVFRWGDGYRYHTHRPPTVLDGRGRDLCAMKWIGPRKIARMRIFCYHYGMVFPKQARQKAIYYRNRMRRYKDMGSWYRNNYLKLRRPFRVLHGVGPPSWLVRFKGRHPPEIDRLIRDCRQGSLEEPRPTADIEGLLASRGYRAVAFFLGAFHHVIVPTRGLLRAGRKALRYIVPGPLRRCIRRTSAWLRSFTAPPLESLTQGPDLFRVYRRLHHHPALQRRPGGWIYEGKFYPDYLMVGGASHAVLRQARKHCRGRGVDIGAGLWPLEGACPVDIERGAGAGKSVSSIERGTLDYVFSSHCLEHIAHWRQALAEWLGKLKPGGIVFLYLPHPDCAIWHPGSPFVGNGHKWIPTPDTIKASLEELGCEIIECDDGPDAMHSFHVCARMKP